jgi:VCBS repeat-containing protein
VHDSNALTFTNNINTRTNSRGVVVTSGTRVGDIFGPIDAGGNRFTSASLSGRNNGIGGVIGGLQIDDIIIGFAERGEQVFNGSTGPQLRGAITATPNYEPVLAPGQPPQNEVETGSYQVEIRTAADYGLTRRDGNLYWIDPETLLPTGRTFGTNDRLAKTISLAVTDTSTIVDRSSFTLSDGSNTLRFEFDVTTSTADPATGVIPGNVPIRIAPNATTVQIAAAIRDAINSTASQASLKFIASTRGDTLGGTANSRLPRASIIDIAGNVSNDVLGGLSGFGVGGAPIAIVFGQDTGFGEDLGDANRRREQGQFIVSSSVVRDSAEFGINISAANSGTDPRPFPGVARNLNTLNSSDVAPGVVIANNVIENNRRGGIRISGAPGAVSPTVVEGPIGVARVLNNTIVGGGASTGSIGIEVTERASPTIINNILAGHSTGISASGIGAPTIVLGGNLYKQNTTPRIPGTLTDTFEVLLQPADPLFIDQARRRYYPAPLSQAIDSSIASLENRSSLEQVKDGVGLPVSSILAPTFDVNGLRRSDDPDVSTPAGQGGNVFIDRGAIDRVDFIGPIAIIQRPLDNDSLGIDDDASSTYLQLEQGNLDFFEILLDERTGTGTDPLTITPESVILTENGRRLVEGSDYVFGFSANSRTIRLTPLAGFWRNDSIYEITLSNRRALQLNVPSGRSLTDGALATVVVGATTLTMEFDSNGTVASGNVPILFTAASSSEAISVQIFRAIRAFGSGATVTALGSDVLLLDGATSVTGLPFVSLVPIEDMAANPLQANRSNTLTQFTIVMPEVGLDFGDGPNRTSYADDGARNAIFPSDSTSLFLGARVDSEADGVPGPLANSDDLVGQLNLGGLVLNDEDGVTFTGVFNEHVIPAVTVAVIVNGDGYLDAWFDWNIDGDYTDAGEQVLTSVGVSNGTFTFLQQAPAGATPGFTTARFRLSSKSGVPDFGVAIGGEVEDYSIEVLPGHPPVAVNDPDPTKLAQYRVNEEGVLNVLVGDGLLFNDTDVDVPVELLQVKDEDLLLPGVQPVRGPANGTLVLNLDGSFTYTPNTDFFGQDTFAYRVTDPRLVSNNTATVTITVNPVNDAPLGFDDLERINEDTVTVWDGSRFTSNDFKGATTLVPPTSIANEESQTLTVVNARFVLADRVTTRPARAGESISVVGNVITYTPGTNYNNSIAGPVFVELEILDNGVSGFPAAADFKNSFSILTIDIDAINDSPSFSLVQPNPPPALPTTTTVPTINALGEMSMSVNVNEDAPTQSLAIFSGITAGPDTAVDEIGLVPGLPGQVVNLNVNVRPQDNYLFTATGRPRVVNRQPNGQAELEFTLAPNANTLLLGPAIVTFQLDDQGGPGAPPNGPTGPLSRMHTVTIVARPVNDPPILVDDSRTFREDVAQSWLQSEFLTNDVTGPANENRQTLSIAAVRLVTPRPGEILTLVNGIISYTPAPNYNRLIGGNVLIELDVRDTLDVGDQGTVQTRTSTLTLTITEENDSPSFSLVELPPISTAPVTDVGTGEMSMTLNINEDAPTQNLRIFSGVAVAPPTALDELGLVSNLPGQPTNFIVTLRPQDVGLFTLTGQPRVNVLTGGAAELEFTLSADVNSLASGPAVVTFQMDDRGGAGVFPNGPTGPTSIVHTVTINVRPVNDPPVVGNDSRTIIEDVAQSWPQADFLANDTVGPPNESAQTLSIVAARIISPTWPGQSVSVSNGRIVYTPGTNYNRFIAGNVLVALDVRDSLDVGDQGVVQTSVSTLTITIDPVNDSPVFNLVQVAPITNAPTTDSTTGSMSLTVTIDEDTPTPKIAIFDGIAPAPALANDELGLVNGLPAQPTDFLVTVRPQDQFLFTATGGPKVNKLANGKGEIEFTLAPNAYTPAGSPAIITFQINDQSGLGSPPNGPTGSFSRIHTVTLAVTSVNDAPVAVADQYTVSEDVVLTVPGPGLLTNDQDVDLPDDVLSINGNSSVSSLGAAVSVASNGQLTYNPLGAVELQRLLGGATANDTFTYTVRDRLGAVSGVATVTVTVTGVNDAPVAVDDVVNVPINTPQVISVLANDSDVDNAINPATVEIGELPIFGSFTVLASGQVEYRPNTGYRGLDTFTYRVRDVLGRASNEGRVRITVNSAPVALPDSAVAGRGQTVVIDVLRNDSDRDGTLNPSSVRIVGGPDSGVATPQANGTVSFTANAQFLGLATFQYIVSDNDGLASNIADVTINVVRSVYQNPVNNLDVDADTFVSPIDVLIVVNDINFNGPRMLPNGLATPPYLDVDGDQGVGPLDVLELINFINSRGNAGAGSEGNGEGEGFDSSGTSQIDVVMMPMIEVMKVNRDAQLQLAVEEGVDLIVSSEADSILYGPMLPIIDDEDSDLVESLETYLARWSNVKEKEQFSPLDSVFAGEDWE